MNRTRRGRKKTMNMHIDLRGATIWLCLVEPGMFSTERLVRVPAGGDHCVGFVDEHCIVDGKVKTQVWDIRGDLLDVVLPGEFDNHLIAVKRSEVDILEKEYAT